MFRVFPGNIADVSTVADLLCRVVFLNEKRIFGAVLDRGYLSLSNLCLCLDAGQRVLIAAKMASHWIREAAEDEMTDLWTSACRLYGCEDWGKTVRKSIEFDDGIRCIVWIHIFRNDANTHTEVGGFFVDLERFEGERDVSENYHLFAR